MTKLSISVILAFFLFISATKRAVTTKVHVVAQKGTWLSRARVTFNEKSFIIRAGRYAEFELPGEKISCKLDVKIPLGNPDQPVLTLTGGGAVYLAIYLKPVRPSDPDYVMDTICQENYLLLKEKSNHRVRVD